MLSGSFVVRLRNSDIQHVPAATVEIRDEHLGLLAAEGTLAALFLFSSPFRLGPSHLERLTFSGRHGQDQLPGRLCGPQNSRQQYRPARRVRTVALPPRLQVCEPRAQLRPEQQN